MEFQNEICLYQALCRERSMNHQILAEQQKPHVRKLFSIDFKLRQSTLKSESTTSQDSIYTTANSPSGMSYAESIS